jgi:hypothetical protein
LRNRLFRNWTVWKCPGEKLHGEQVARREAAHVRKLCLEIGGEAVDDFGPPGGLLLAGEDDISRVPVGLDDDGIGGKDGTDAGAAEVVFYLLKRGGIALRQRRGRGSPVPSPPNKK